ncbi:hypothetical protein [Leptospira sp. GIMC2001]|uniref:hypothetical protein n=1 Tax=Leptospira sp. GIMC2001 TaxID=1513297 RepID=UPI00234B6A71|nr:hypothetical protein [Leptospira sp. GIMC2001]WCL49694.1 hypothetical protein O4O04_02425 [Leptospira sp. GIMC2001]
MIKKLIYISFLILASCIAIPIRNYEIDKSVIKTNLFEKSIKILFFEDLRKGENINKTAYSFIPFFISGNFELNFPESDGISLNTPFKYYFADILKKELEGNYNFKSIMLTDDKSIITDYTIKGEISKFYCERKLYTYGLSFYGVLLWYLGVPAMANECEIELKLDLMDSNNLEILSKVYSDKKIVYSGLYYNINNLDRVYSHLLKNIMNVIKSDIKKNMIE